MADATKQLRIVAFQEGDGWIAQCVEYDMCVQGSDIAQAKRRMTALIRLEADHTMEIHGEPFAGLESLLRRNPSDFSRILASAIDSRDSV